MLCEKLTLLRFFGELCSLSATHLGKPGYGFGCKHLMEDLIKRPGSFVTQIMQNYDRDFHEYRLNDAGLKLYWKVVRKENQPPQFQCYISGDQLRDYPEFVYFARELIINWDANHRL